MLLIHDSSSHEGSGTSPRETHDRQLVQRKLKMDGSGTEESDLAADTHLEEGTRGRGQEFKSTSV